MTPFVWAKVFDFSFTTIAKILSLVFKILIIIGLPALALWGVYVTAIRPHTKPNPTTQQKAETIINNNYNCKSLIGWGCNGPRQNRKEPNGNPNSAVSGGGAGIPKN